jgi:prepilin-type N-terminal cleavage/methylation domain-containing protein
MASVVLRARRRLRADAGFGMVELLIAMTVMAIGILALFAMFESSVLQIKRASTTSTAAALADTEMENYRAIKHNVIGLDDTAVVAADATHKGDAAFVNVTGTSTPTAGARAHVVACGTGTCTTSVPTKTVTGADNRSYRVDTYVSWQGVSSGRPVKLVTVVVRDNASPYRTWARVASSFDESTGQ